MTKLRAVKGMNDLLPEELGRWRRLESIFRETAERYGFGEIRTPLLEPTELFVRSIGEATDIVEKEMYTFHDKGEKNLTLRPEGTASCARAYLEHTVGAERRSRAGIISGPCFGGSVRREDVTVSSIRPVWRSTVIQARSSTPRSSICLCAS